MSTERYDKSGREKRSSLVDAVRDIKIAAAERNDVVIEMKEADRARLEILGQELQPVFEDVPLDDERFDFAMSSGLQPRLWIDATAHVIMGKDRRQYRFVRDTRMGRIVMAESNQTAPIASAVTKYIAERLYEREMALADEDVTYRSGVSQRAAPEMLEADESDYESELDIISKSFKSRLADLAGRQKEQNRVKPGLLSTSVPMAAKDRESKVSTSPIVWLLIGLFVGAGALLLWFNDAIFASLG